MLIQSGARWIRLSVKTLRVMCWWGLHSVRAVAQLGSGGQRTARPTKSAASSPTQKHTSNPTEGCVLHANEEKQRSCLAWAPRHGLCLGGDGTAGTVLPGSSREP